VAVGSVKPAIATLDLSDYRAESEEETKEEKLTKEPKISLQRRES
jgi:PHD/YefM family antitoxin component YafN of YafNO toxin-antitoxin module